MFGQGENFRALTSFYLRVYINRSQSELLVLVDHATRGFPVQSRRLFSITTERSTSRIKKSMKGIACGRGFELDSSLYLSVIAAILVKFQRIVLICLRFNSPAVLLKASLTDDEWGINGLIIQHEMANNTRIKLISGEKTELIVVSCGLQSRSNLIAQFLTLIPHPRTQTFPGSNIKS